MHLGMSNAPFTLSWLLKNLYIPARPRGLKPPPLPRPESVDTAAGGRQGRWLHFHEVADEALAAVRQYAFGVELDAPDAMAAVGHAHDLPLAGL